MKEMYFVYNGKTYRRDVEMMGDVHFIKWFYSKNGFDKEIYDQDFQVELEDAYEATIMNEIMFAAALPLI